MKRYKFSNRVGIAGLHGEALLCEAGSVHCVSSAFTASQLVMCILQFLTELLTGSGGTAVACLWPLENFTAMKNYFVTAVHS